MDFISYTLFDFAGTLQGLDFGTYFANALKNGSIITPIIYFFLFLSIIRITNHIIVTKEYGKAVKDSLVVFAFVLLFIITGTFKVWNVNITKGTNQGKENIYLNFVSKTGSNLEILPDASSSFLTVSNVPMMFVFPSLMDGLSYTISEVILGKKELDENLIKKHLKLYPQDIIPLAFISVVSEEPDIARKASLIKMFAYCYHVDDVIQSMIADKGLSEDDKKMLESLRDEIKEFANPIKVETEVSTSDALNQETSTSGEFGCQKIYNALSNKVKTLANQLFPPPTNDLGIVETSNTNTSDEIYRTLLLGWADEIKDGATPLVLKKQILRGLIAQKDAITSLYNVYNEARTETNALTTAFDRAISFLKQASVTLFNSRSFYEWFLYKINGLAVFLILAMFPLAVSFAFLPAFGYRWQLFASYLGAYFLVKMWIPLYLIAYKFLTGQLSSSIGSILYGSSSNTLSLTSSVLSLFGTSAYAEVNTETYVALISLLEQQETLTEYIMNILAISIPTALGGGATFLLGKEFFFASKQAIAESIFTAKTAMMSLSKLGGINPSSPPGNPDGPPSEGHLGSSPKEKISDTLNPNLSIYGTGGGIMAPETLSNLGKVLNPNFNREKISNADKFLIFKENQLTGIMNGNEDSYNFYKFI